MDKIKCNNCGCILDTNTHYHLLFCSCGKVGVDGGEDYVRILGWKDDWSYVIKDKEEDEK